MFGWNGRYDYLDHKGESSGQGAQHERKAAPLMVRQSTDEGSPKETERGRDRRD